MKSLNETKNLNGSSKKRSFDIFWIFKSFTHKWIAIIVFLILWQILPPLGVVNEIFIPTPTTIALSGWEMILSGSLIVDISVSLSRVITGFLLALAVALPLGFILGGFFKNFEKALDPLLQVFGQANPFTLFPVFIVFLGIGELSKVAIIFWVTQWPILFNTVTGIKNVDPVLVKVGRATGLGKLDIFKKILLPASLPTVFTGIRMGAVFAFFMLIGAEMIGATSGLGFLIMQSQMTMNIPAMWVGIVTVAIFGVIFLNVISAIENRLTKWKEDSAI